jgi:hypothetical protein
MSTLAAAVPAPAPEESTATVAVAGGTTSSTHGSMPSSNPALTSRPPSVADGAGELPAELGPGPNEPGAEGVTAGLAAALPLGLGDAGGPARIARARAVSGSSSRIRAAADFPAFT